MLALTCPLAKLWKTVAVEDHYGVDLPNRWIHKRPVDTRLGSLTRWGTPVLGAIRRRAPRSSVYPPADSPVEGGHGARRGARKTC